MTLALDTALNNVAVRQGNRGFTFEDLTRPAGYQGATMGQLVGWLAQARSSEFVETVGCDHDVGTSNLGPMRYRVVRLR